MLRHDPAVVAGLALIGGGASLFFHIVLKLERVGRSSYKFFKSPMTTNWDTLRVYLNVRSEYGWPAWPVYWCCLLYAAGVVSLVFGPFRL
jgi:hypothetical protein